MRGNSEIIGTLLLALIALSLATIVHGVVLSLSNKEPQTTDLNPLPVLLSAKGSFVANESTYLIDVNLTFTTCKGTKDAQAVLLGENDNKTFILGIGEIKECEDGVAKATIRAGDITSYSKFYIYAWKMGQKSETVPITLVEGSLDDGEG